MIRKKAVSIFLISLLLGFSSPIFAVSPFEVSIDSDENVEVISEAVDETSQYNPLDQIEEA